MQTTSGLLTSLSQRLGSLGTPTVVVLTLLLVVAAVLATMVVADLMGAVAVPLQAAPVRWRV